MQGGAPARKAGFRLRQIGARDLAGGEAIARLPQRRLQHPDVVALKLEQGGVAQQIHIGGGGVEQDRLLGGAQRLARGENLALGQAGPAGSLETVEKRLPGRQSVATGANGADRPVVANVVRALGERVQVLLADLGRRRDCGAIAGQRHADVFVGRAGGGALGIDLRIILVGERQRAFKRVGVGPMHGGAGQRGGGDESHPRGPRNQTRTPRAIQH